MKHLQNIIIASWIITFAALLNQSAWGQTGWGDASGTNNMLIGQQSKQNEDTTDYNRQIDQQFQILQMRMQQLENQRRINELQRQIEELRRQTN